MMPHPQLRSKGLIAVLVLLLILPARAASVSSTLSDTSPRDLGAIGAGEGPAWSADGYLLFTGGGQITKRTEEGKVSIFRREAGGANGLLFDQQGALLVCESKLRRVTRMERNGQITVLADQFEGKRFNTPNDLTTDSKGRIYFSDPRYGPRDDMEIRDPDGKLVEAVYRIDAPGKVARVTHAEIERPNGLLVSPDDRYLYVADNNNNNVGGARKLFRFDLRPDGSIDPDSRKLIFDWKNARGPDGFKLGPDGRFYVAAGLNRPHPPYETANTLRGGIYVLETNGTLVKFVPIPNDEVTNCAFGGKDRKTLFITAGGHLWSWTPFSPSSH